MCFGETAVLDGGGRSAEAVADEPSLVHRLAAEDLAQLRREAPDVAVQVYLNLARHLSRRLREASTAWRQAAA
jgi:glutaminase